MKKLVAITLSALLTVPVLAQEKSETKPTPVAIRLQVVIARYQGDRKISSRPYTLSISSDKQATVRIGTEVPVSVTLIEKEGRDMTSFQYKNVGINMECTVVSLGGGRYLLDPIAFEESSLFGEGQPIAPTPNYKQPDAPLFRVNTMRGSVVIKDGETVPFYSATEPTTGEVIKGDVTLNVVK
jgi:hypothetical protein